MKSVALYVLRAARKALVAGATTTAGTAGGLMADGDLTGPEIVIAVGAGLVAAAAVYGVANKPA